MKVLPFKIPKPEEDGLVYQEDITPVFYDKLHQHEEIQISYIVQGYGTLIVGDTVSDFEAGDLIVIGSTLPHVFKSAVQPGKNAVMLTLFFTYTSFGREFFELEELRSCSNFFKKAAYGFKVRRKSDPLEHLFKGLKKASKFQRFLSLLEIIKQLSRGKHQLLSSYIYDKQFSIDEGNRMRNVMEFTINNYHHRIALSEVANVANMTKNSFCKYFKKRTNKTYFRFLNELRVEHAIRLLNDDEGISIATIAEQSGFQNISYFNRTFKQIKGHTPSGFKMTLSS